MVKYNESLKFQIVQEYLKGPLGAKLLARKYNIKSHKQIQYWVAAYGKSGKAGLEIKGNKTVYSVQFKLDVLNFMKSTGASLKDTAFHFGLNNPPMISSWKNKFLEGGAEALDKPRGRPAMTDKAKDGRNEKKKQNKEMTNEQKLERENELLRLEVAYLKKLRAFQKDPEAYLEKHRQRYHSSSKKNSD